MRIQYSKDNREGWIEDGNANWRGCCIYSAIKRNWTATFQEDFIIPDGSGWNIQKLVYGEPTALPPVRRVRDTDIHTTEIRFIRREGTNGKLIYTHPKPVNLAEKFSKCLGEVQLFQLPNEARTNAATVFVELSEQRPSYNRRNSLHYMDVERYVGTVVMENRFNYFFACHAWNESNTCNEPDCICGRVTKSLRKGFRKWVQNEWRLDAVRHASIEHDTVRMDSVPFHETNWSEEVRRFEFFGRQKICPHDWKKDDWCVACKELYFRMRNAKYQMKGDLKRLERLERMNA